MSAVEGFLEREIHPTVIVNAYFKALDEIIRITESLGEPIDIENEKDLQKIVSSCIGTKFSSKWGNLIVDLAVKAVKTVYRKEGDYVEIDVKRYAKVEKIPGGLLEECEVLDGVMFNKDVTHPGMRRVIKNPRVVLLECPLEYKKGESMTNMEFTKEDDFKKALAMEEEEIKKMCEDILRVKPDVVITEKGVSDLAQHYFAKANITAFRRLRKTDNNRVARATGATIVSRTDEIRESDIGTGCGLFEMRKIGEEYFAFFEECKDPKACTIILRGGSKDVLNEIERNLTDAMLVVRNVVFDPRLLPGGGATEMAVSVGLRKAGLKLEGVQQGPFLAVGEAMEVIPRTLAQNCGVSVIRTVTQLRAKHASAYEEEEKKNGEGSFPKCNWGIDGTTGKLVDMEEFGIWEPFSVKIQTIKTAIESACMIL